MRERWEGREERVGRWQGGEGGRVERRGWEGSEGEVGG